MVNVAVGAAALGLEWLHHCVDGHRQRRRSMVHGVLARFFFQRSKRLGRATG
jgi:hypothetical protein